MSLLARIVQQQSIKVMRVATGTSESVVLRISDCVKGVMEQSNRLRPIVFDRNPLVVEVVGRCAADCRIFVIISP